jgi:hypothetical protein
MNSQIIAALIGAFATIIAALIAKYKDTVLLGLRIKPRRVAGFWRGRAFYHSNRNQGRDFTCSLSQFGNKISGTLASAGEYGTEYEIDGRFLESEFLLITIKNKKDDMLNYATGILKLDRFAKAMTGQFVGRARTAEDIVLGTLELTKE